MVPTPGCCPHPLAWHLCGRLSATDGLRAGAAQGAERGGCLGLRHDLSPPPLRRDSRHRRNAARGRGCVPTQLPCATAGGRGPPTAGCWPRAERTPLPLSFVLSLGDPRRGVATPPSGGAQTGKSDYAATTPQCCPPVPRSGGPMAGFHRWPWSGKVVSFPSVDSGTCGSPGQRWTKVVPVRADRQ